MNKWIELKKIKGQLNYTNPKITKPKNPPPRADKADTFHRPTCMYPFPWFPHASQTRPQNDIVKIHTQPLKQNHTALRAVNTHHLQINWLALTPGSRAVPHRDH